MNPFEVIAKPPTKRHARRPDVRRRGNKPPRSGWIAPIANPWGLSGMQCEVLRRLAEGQTSKTIAAEFCMSSGTVDVHVCRAMEKMGVCHRIHAVALWVRHSAGEKT